MRRVLFSQPVSLAERTRSIDHYRRFKAISFFVIKTILARRHVDDRTRNFIPFSGVDLTCTCIGTKEINQVINQAKLVSVLNPGISGLFYTYYLLFFLLFFFFNSKFVANELERNVDKSNSQFYSESFTTSCKLCLLNGGWAIVFAYFRWLEAQYHDQLLSIPGRIS